MPSRATKYQNDILGSELNIDMANGAGARKLDLQCRTGSELEVNNSEFKRCFTTRTELDKQLRKNITICHSMMLYLKEKIALPLETYEVQALDVHGKLF